VEDHVIPLEQDLAEVLPDGEVAVVPPWSAGITSNTLPCRMNWATDPDLNRSHISLAHGGRGRLIGSPCPWRRGIGGRLFQEVLHTPVDLLLLLDPLGRPSQVSEIWSIRWDTTSGLVVSTACSRTSSACSWIRTSSASRKASFSRPPSACPDAV